MTDFNFTKEEFDFDKMKKTVDTLGGFNSFIIGGSGTGKTVLIKYIMETFKDLFQYMFLFINIKENAENYTSYIQYNHIFTEDDLKKTSKNTNCIEEKATSIGQYISNKCKDAKVLIISDDIGENNKQYYKEFFSRSRHVKVSNIVLIHESKHIFSKGSVHYLFITDPNVVDDYLKKKYDSKNLNNIVQKILLSENGKKYAVITRDKDIFYLEANNVTLKNDIVAFYSDSYLKRKVKRYFERYIKENNQ